MQSHTNFIELLPYDILFVEKEIVYPTGVCIQVDWSMLLLEDQEKIKNKYITPVNQDFSDEADYYFLYFFFHKTECYIYVDDLPIETNEIELIVQYLEENNDRFKVTLIK